MQSVQHLINSRPLNDEIDSWVYNWGSNVFTSAKVYRSLIGHLDIHQSFKWLWKNNCQPKHKATSLWTVHLLEYAGILWACSSHIVLAQVSTHALLIILNERLV